MRIGPLFSGIGGLELGLEWAGVGHTAWQVEQDEYCRRVLARHWPAAMRFNDVREVGAHNLEPVDVICGGYPCQPFSIAGRQEGESDPRHLWPEFARIVGELRPRYAVLENVPAHLGLGFGNVLGDLSGLGYDAEWQVLSARDVGAPHLRERIFVIAYTERPRLEGPVAHDGVSRGTGAPHAKRRDRGAFPWRSLDAHLGSGRGGDGLRVGMERLRIAAIGNAVVPQVAEVVGRRLLAIERDLFSPAVA